MKKLLFLFILFSSIFIISNAQVTNLLVKGQASDFNVHAGDMFGWSFNVPTPGDTTMVQIWVDADQNGILNTSTDVIWTFFNQIDGSEGDNGPSDADGIANGYVSFEMPLGLAPAHYILLFKNHNFYKTFNGIVTEPTTYTTTVSGTVTVPNGVNKKNISLSMECKNGSSVPFWNSLTDADGNYAIRMNAENSAEWNLRIDNSGIFGSAITAPQNIQFIIDPAVPSYTGKNFTITLASAEITGILKNENGSPIISADVSANANMGAFNRYTRTDTAGRFHIGFMESELPMSDISLGSQDRYDSLYMQPNIKIPYIYSGKILTHDIVKYKKNSTISGRFTVDGMPLNYYIVLSASCPDSGFTTTRTDIDGYFTFNVSDKIFNYDIYPTNGFFGTSNFGKAHPGQTNVMINLVTDVKNESEVPAEFNLSQNYPNPFNPSTTINYAIAKEGNVKLTVYNAIGVKVADLVNENKPAGNYTIDFNGSKLASGIYFYKLESGNFTSTKKLMLIK